MPDQSDEATLDLANTLVRERLESQKSGIERTETKTTLLLGFGLVGLQFVLTRSRHTGWMLVAASFYGLSLLFGLAGVFLYEHDFPPDPERLVEAYLELPRWHVLDVVVRTRAHASYRNHQARTVQTESMVQYAGFPGHRGGILCGGFMEGLTMGKEEEPTAPPSSPPPAPPGKADPLLGGSTDTRGYPPPEPRDR